MTKYQEFTTHQAKITESKLSIMHLTDITSMLQQMEFSKQRQNSPHRQISGVNFNLADIPAGILTSGENNSNNNAGTTPGNLVRIDTAESTTSVASDTTKFSERLSRQLSMNTNQLQTANDLALSKILPIDENYSQLTLAIDLFLQSKEEQKLLQLARENVDVSHALFDLAAHTAQSKERREVGIRTTTEIKQFLLYNHFNVAANKLGFTVGGRVGDVYSDDEEEGSGGEEGEGENWKVVLQVIGWLLPVMSESLERVEVNSNSSA